MKTTGILIASLLGFTVTTAALPALAQPQSGPSGGVALSNTITGEKLDLSEGKPGGRDTPGVKKFLETGENVYLADRACLRNGESLYATSCSGCHGHVAEGKLGPGLNDNYWTYPSNTEDTGLFATIWGGANGMMGPHSGNLTPDEVLQVVAWIRHLYKGPKQDAVWLNAEQKKTYKPYAEGEKFSNDEQGQCKPLEQ